jgi:hypothetical protein
MAPATYRIALSPFRPVAGEVDLVVGDLAPKGFLADQLCLVGQPSAIAPLSSAIDPKSSTYPSLSSLVANLEKLHLPSTPMPVVASAGPILDVFLKQQSWLSSPAAAPLRRQLESGNLVLAVNGLDHAQFEHAARLLLRHGSGNLSTHIFHWPQTPE